MSYSKERPFIKVDVTGAVDKKFDDINTQFSETVKKGENESISLGMLDQPLKESIADGLLPVVGEDSVNTANIVDGSVTLDKFHVDIKDDIALLLDALVDDGETVGEDE